MNGLRFDFEQNDITLSDDGSFETAEVSSQTCALISLSLVCRLTKPELGESLGVKLMDRRFRNVAREISSAIRATEEDGGKNVSITLSGEGDLHYFADYGED